MFEIRITKKSIKWQKNTTRQAHLTTKNSRNTLTTNTRILYESDTIRETAFGPEDNSMGYLPKEDKPNKVPH